MSDDKQRDKRTANHAEPKGDKKDSSADRMTLVTELGETPPNPPATKNGQTRGERYFYLGTQAALVVITGIGIAIALCTLRDLSENVADTHRQAMASIGLSRAWMVPATWVLNTERYPDGSVAERIQILWANVGHAPAIGLEGVAEVLAPSTDLGTVTACPSKGRHDTRDFMLPNEPTNDIKALFSVPALSTPASSEAEWNASDHVFIVHQCLNYEDAVSDTGWFSDFCLMVTDSESRGTFKAAATPCGPTMKMLRFGSYDKQSHKRKYE